MRREARNAVSSLSRSIGARIAEPFYQDRAILFQTSEKSLSTQIKSLAIEDKGSTPTGSGLGVQPERANLMFSKA